MIKYSILNSADSIVIKIGSSLLINENKFNSRWLSHFIDDIIFLIKKKKKIVIVASGAVSLGKKYLNINQKTISIEMKQACAACGQVILMKNFMRSFEKKKKKVAQILLTFSDTEDRRKSLNSRETIKSLIESNIIPIINENDTVATDELKFGDNDRLAARVAQVINADLLILLSDVNGLYNKNPKLYKDATLINKVPEINSKIFKMSTSETNDYGSGGMFTKIQAAEIAFTFGCDTVIMKGNLQNPILNFEKKKKGTLFKAQKKNKKDNFKNWLGGSINISGSVKIDDGATQALKNGASLLPSGVKKITGKFVKGDIIEILNDKGKKIGRGISYYDSSELNLIKGKKSIYIKDTLGYEGREEIIHRDYLFLNIK
ncbi:MAG: glutamate 5-kinase [Alphaproteobacteria bacterium]|nr:glutamate 5-kinase [Alphaproteobacteria bacterium]